MQNYKNYFELETPSYGGLNTAVQFSLIPKEQSPRMENAFMDQVGDISQRPGSAPVISEALDDPITLLTTYPFEQKVPTGVSPTLSVTGSDATLPAATYYVRFTYVTAEGETEASPEASQAITLGEALRVVVPDFPVYATSVNIYIGTASNAEKLERNSTTLSNDFTEQLDGTGVVYPTVNSTAFSGALLAVSGTSLFAYYNNLLKSLTMTNPLKSDNVFTADFTGINAGSLVNIKIIADGGILKSCNGKEVKDVTPAADGASPAPANVLIDINSLGIKYVWEHSQHVFVSPGDNQMWYSKRAGAGGTDNQYNYFPETSFLMAVRKGDYINGCGIPFDSVCFVPMRQGWCVIKGTYFEDFDSGEFLNTINGLIAPRSSQIITYPNGFQTIAYLSDDGVHEIFTLTLDTQGRQYATRGIMKEKIDFNAMGFTEAEKTAAVSKYIVSLNMYLLEITRDTTHYVYGFDTRNAQWYLWKNLQINSFIEIEGVCYFSGDDGLLKTFDRDLYSDWDDMEKTTGKPVHWKRYSPANAAEFSGFASMWDAFLVESQQWYVPATLDITFIFANNTDVMEDIIRNEVFVEGVSQWGYAKYANVNFTDLVNEPNEIIFDYSRLSKYVQVLMENDRDEPVKLFKEKWKGRASGK